MRYKFIFLIIAAAAMPLLLTHKAYAHFPAYEGSYTVTLHVNPDDSPTPKQPASLNFIIDDRSDRFNMAGCICQVKVTEGGSLIFNSLIHQQSPSVFSVYNSTIPFVFPDRAVYHIELKGQPSKVGAFSSFDLGWNFRVDQYPIAPPKSMVGTIIKLLAGIVGLAIITGLIVYGLSARASGHKPRARTRIKK